MYNDKITSAVAVIQYDKAVTTIKLFHALNTAFNHTVGISTFQYGIAVPKPIHHVFTVPKRGQKRKINVLNNGQQYEAVLRTLDNDVERVQIRYKHEEAKRITHALGDKREVRVSILDNNTFMIV